VKEGRRKEKGEEVRYCPLSRERCLSLCMFYDESDGECLLASALKVLKWAAERD